MKRSGRSWRRRRGGASMEMDPRLRGPDRDGLVYTLGGRGPRPLSTTSEALTHGIRVQVQSRYLAERSQPEQSQYFFIYQVRISNEGTRAARLISRHWVITDGNGHV